MNKGQEKLWKQTLKTTLAAYESPPHNFALPFQEALS
jgi:hypothetical protein